MTPGYFYAPRYVVLGLVSLTALVLLLKRWVVLDHPAFIPLGLLVIFSTVSEFLTPIPMTAWMGSLFRFTGLSTGTSKSSSPSLPITRETRRKNC